MVAVRYELFDLRPSLIYIQAAYWIFIRYKYTLTLQGNVFKHDFLHFI